MTWKKILIAVITILSLTVIHGETQDRSFLWKIQSGTGNSYLLGSIHMMKKEHYPLKPVIEDAFAHTDVLAVEADLSGAKAADGFKMLQLGMYTGDETLQKNISPKTYQLVKEKMKTLSMEIDGFQKFKPWMLALTIQSMALMSKGFTPTHGIDLHFLNKAAGKKEIVELEGIEFQMKLFESFSKEESEQLLISSVVEADNMAKEVNNMVDAWLNGDTGKLERLFNEGTEKYPELAGMYKKLLDDRNERMVEKILTYMKTGKKYFIVIGAAHMVGEKGIVRLLQKKGFTVTQL